MRAESKVKLRSTICAAVLSLLLPLAPPAHTASRAAARPASSAFDPLDRWKAAVLAGDFSALSDLYTKIPAAQTKLSGRAIQDPEEEPHFWSALASRGVANLNPKILEIERPQPGTVALVLRIEFTLRTNSGDQPFLVEASQVWVQQGNAWRIYITQRSDLAPNPPIRLPEPVKPNTDLYPAPDEAPAEISAALRAAATDHKRVILVFGGNWCYDCHVLDAAFHSSKIGPLVNANYHVVHVNIGDGDKNLDLADKYGVPLRQAVRVPSLAVLDSSGKVVYSQRNGEFDDSARLSPADVTAFLEKWKPARPG